VGGEGGEGAGNRNPGLGGKSGSITEEYRGYVVFALTIFGDLEIYVSRDIIKVCDHRVDRVLSLFSSRPYWDSPTPSPAGERPPPLWFRGNAVHTPSREMGWGVPIPTRRQIQWYSRYIVLE
jgi:hypothetical protein